MSVDTQTQILVRHHSRGTEVVLSPPAGRPPTLDGENLGQLKTLLEDLHANPPSLVIVRANSEKYFCVGANIRVLAETTPESIGPWVHGGHAVFDLLEDLPCVTVAAVEGFALGGGLELALACDLIFADASATLGLPETRLGFIPGWGGVGRLANRIGVAQAKRLIFSAEMVNADSALSLGLVDQVCPAGGMEECLQTFRESLVPGCPKARADVKKLLARSRDGIAEREAALSRACVERPETADRLANFLNRKKSS
ncbi:MAG: enoyl-CoA hydratase/isomerase family protein [Verrucomicrobia bacterium]|nr:enoyl-CoA hydratase/isomerase family protein [Verrucomicrobiota bacterium]MCH8511186.1 enoyl-CoA hydratase/isomerase family protein [Kiritimatiellia bacterium]